MTGHTDENRWPAVKYGRDVFRVDDNALKIDILMHPSV